MSILKHFVAMRTKADHRWLDYESTKVGSYAAGAQCIVAILWPLFGASSFLAPSTQGLRRGLYSFAAPRLRSGQAFGAWIRG
jgi:hypothetical protein